MILKVIKCATAFIVILFAVAYFYVGLYTNDWIDYLTGIVGFLAGIGCVSMWWPIKKEDR